MLKKILLTILALLALAACGGAPEDLSYRKEERALFFEDLDYLATLLEDNLALWSVIYRDRGVDIHALTESARDEILRADNMDNSAFISILARHFEPLDRTAHFYFRFIPPFVPEDFDYDIEELAQYFNVDLENENAYMFLRMVAGSKDWITGLYYMARLEMGLETAARFLSSIQNADFYEFLAVSEIEEQNLRHQIVTEILESDRIAYIALPRLSWYVHRQDEQIFDFYEKIQGFEHLIVDIRGNKGGHAYIFKSFIIEPNITEPLAAYRFAFGLPTTPISQERLAFTRYQFQRFTGPHAAVPAPQILETYHLPDINLEDVAKMEDAFKFESYASPNLLSRFNYQTAFDGKIWLLIDDGVGSAAELSTRFAQETGFATLVGDVSGGNFGGPLRTWHLRNSGILVNFDTLYVTDSLGRPFEAGTIPCHPNREGKDALQTTLALIDEGQY